MAENRDPVNTTHIISWADLKNRYPSIGWDQLAAINGSGIPDRADVHQLTAISQIDQMISTVPLEDWKVFLTYKLIDAFASSLSAPFEEEDFDFYGRTLSGIQSPDPRWKRVIKAVNAGLPDDVGKRYVATYFNESARDEAKNLTHAIRLTLRERIKNLTWMEPSTKASALEKLDAIVEKVGYPDTWMDYSGINLNGTYATNLIETSRYNHIYGPLGFATIGKPVDRKVWYISPQTVNAFYNSQMNEIDVPAAMFQPPFYYPGAEDAINYGGMGSFIGHELTHGFDDQGRQYDKDGNLLNWWTDSDTTRYLNQTKLLVDQYDQFEIVPGVYGNGQVALGENLADLGGLVLGYYAWKENGRDIKNPRDAANLTPAQKYFIAHANCWAGSARDEYLRTQAYTDPHPWEKFRANGPLFNMPEFYDAFPGIGPDNTLYRPKDQRPVIW